MNQNPIKPDEYRRLVARMTPHSRHLRGCFRAFWVGGLICTFGQALNALAERLQLPRRPRRCSPRSCSYSSARRSPAWASTTASANTPGPAPSCRSPALPTPSARRRWSFAARASCSHRREAVHHRRPGARLWHHRLHRGWRRLLGDSGVADVSRMGTQTLVFDSPPFIAAQTSIVGPKEGKGRWRNGST